MIYSAEKRAFRGSGEASSMQVAETIRVKPERLASIRLCRERCLHLRKDSVRHESATGIPLGLCDGVRFPSRRLSLDPGDMLLLYTDGLTESCNSSGEEYGFRRIKRVAAQHLRTTPSKLISECLSDHRNFQSGAKQVDDLTLLVIRRTG